MIFFFVAVIRDGVSGKVSIVDLNQPLQPADIVLSPGSAVMAPIVISERDRIAGTPEYRRRFESQMEPGFVRPEVLRNIEGDVVHPPAAALDNRLNNYFRNSQRFVEDKLPRYKKMYDPELDDDEVDIPEVPRRETYIPPWSWEITVPDRASENVRRINEWLAEHSGGAPEPPVFDSRAVIKETWIALGFDPEPEFSDISTDIPIPAEAAYEFPQKYETHREFAVSSLKISFKKQKLNQTFTGFGYSNL